MEIKNLLKNIKLHESTISMILGAVIIIVTGVLVINYFEGKRGETISTIETEETAGLPTTHTIEEGEDLWKISERYYGSGYNWVDIATENNITNPDQIKTGDELSIPDVAPKIASNEIEITPEPTIEVPALIEEKQDSEKAENIHKVAQGEDLWKISERYYGSGYNWVDIARENNITNPNQIEEGQEIVLPQIESKSTPTLADTNMSEEVSRESYTVQKGDSLWDIALSFYGDGYRWIDIAKENHLINPNVIHVGNTLSIPQ